MSQIYAKKRPVEETQAAFASIPTTKSMKVPEVANILDTIRDATNEAAKVLKHIKEQEQKKKISPICHCGATCCRIGPFYYPDGTHTDVFPE